MRYQVKTKDCLLTVKAKASWGEEINTTALESFARLQLRGFLKPKVLRKNLIEYTGPVGCSLYERLKRPLTKRDFLFIMEHIVIGIQKIEANGLDLNRVVLDIRNVFINDTTKEVQFLYVPSSRSIENPGVIAFIESIIYSVTPASGNDTEFVSRFNYFLKSLKGFKAEMVEKYIAKEDRSVVNTIKKQNLGQSGFMTDRQEKKQTDQDRDKAALTVDDDDETGPMYEDDETGPMYEDDETGPMMGDNDEDGTDLLLEETTVRYPALYRVLTEETISINKPVFRLGKERSYVDYFVTNNNAVSRSHADIITRGSKYFVMDLNSKNHTYINDQLIAAQCETEIHDGDRLRLGNEEFIFNL